MADHVHPAPSLPGGIWAGYSDEYRPLGGYSILGSVFAATAGAAALAARKSGKRPPARVAAADIVLIGAATQKLSRLISKDSATSFIRAPFTHYEEPGAPGEVNESRAEPGSSSRSASCSVVHSVLHSGSRRLSSVVWSLPREPPG